MRTLSLPSLLRETAPIRLYPEDSSGPQAAELRRHKLMVGDRLFHKTSGDTELIQPFDGVMGDDGVVEGSIALHQCRDDFGFFGGKDLSAGFRRERRIGLQRL